MNAIIIIFLYYYFSIIIFLSEVIQDAFIYLLTSS